MLSCLSEILAWVSLVSQNQAVCSIIYRPLETQQRRKVATSTLYGKVKHSLTWSLRPKHWSVSEPCIQSFWLAKGQQWIWSIKWIKGRLLSMRLNENFGVYSNWHLSLAMSCRINISMYMKTTYHGLELDLWAYWFQHAIEQHYSILNTVVWHKWLST